MADIRKRFANKLDELRIERGLSQEQLAERAGITPEYVSRIKGGRKSPSMTVIENLANALGVEVKTLFDWGSTQGMADPVLVELVDVVRQGTPEQRQMVLKVARTILAESRPRKGVPKKK